MIEVKQVYSGWVYLFKKLQVIILGKCSLKSKKSVVSFVLFSKRFGLGRHVFKRLGVNSIKLIH